jgi:hypothetical protein
MPTTKPKLRNIAIIAAVVLVTFWLMSRPYIFFPEKLLLLGLCAYIVYRILKKQGAQFKGLVTMRFIFLLVVGSLFAMVAALESSSVAARSIMGGSIYTIAEDDHMYEEATFTLTRHSLFGSTEVGSRFFDNGYRGTMEVGSYHGHPYISTGGSPMHEYAETLSR